MTVTDDEMYNRITSLAVRDKPTKVSDLIADYLACVGATTAFVVQGGCAVHLIDSAARHEGIHVVPVQHEQAGAMAADAVSRVTDGLGLAIATSGPGATNLLTGVCCSFYDSIPTLMLTGQVPTGQLKGSTGSRQVGFQETDVVSIFTPVTKFAAMLTDPRKVLSVLDEAVLTAVTGRMGPVLIDICDDVQRAVVVPSELPRWLPHRDGYEHRSAEDLFGAHQKHLLKTWWDRAQRPMVIVGAGTTNDAEPIKEFLRKSDIPFLCTWAVVDRFSLLSNCVGIFGTTSSFVGNYAVQSADLILSIGTRLDSHEIGNNQAAFAPNAKKIMVDLDTSEINKFNETPVRIDLGLPIPTREFLSWALSDEGLCSKTPDTEWRDYLSKLRASFPRCSPGDRSQHERVNPYFFMEVLSELLPLDAIVVPDCGSNLIWTMQGLELTSDKQRLFSAWNHSPMGYALPAAIGCATTTDSNSVICITGDGGLQMNVQELATVERGSLPLKIVVMNNHGHGIIQGTQDQWLESRHVGSNFAGGLPDPNYAQIFAAYGIPVLEITGHSQVASQLEVLMKATGPLGCVVDMLPRSQIYPKLLAGAPLHEMSPSPAIDLQKVAGQFLLSLAGSSES